MKNRKPHFKSKTTLADAVDADKSAKLHAIAVQNKQRQDEAREKYEMATMLKKINFLESYFKKCPDPQYIKVFGLEPWLEARLFKCYAFLPTKDRRVYLVKRLS